MNPSIYRYPSSFASAPNGTVDRRDDHPTVYRATLPGSRLAPQARHFERRHVEPNTHRQYPYAPVPPAPTFTANHYQWSTSDDRQESVHGRPGTARGLAAVETMPPPARVAATPTARIGVDGKKRTSTNRPELSRSQFDCLLYASMMIRTPKKTDESKETPVRRGRQTVPTPTPQPQNVPDISTAYRYRFDDDIVPDIDLTKSPTPVKPARSVSKKRTSVPNHKLPMRKRSKEATRDPLKELTKNSNTNAVVPGKSLKPVRTTTDEERSCRCKNNRCLKLYCECFAGRALCDAERCSCKDCENTSVHSAARLEAVEKVLKRDKNAFMGRRPTRKENRAAMLKLGENEEVTCSCPKSKCLKKYCQCYYIGQNCTDSCQCVGCENAPGHAASHRVGSKTMKPKPISEPSDRFMIKQVA